MARTAARVKKKNKTAVRARTSYYDYSLLAVVIILISFGLIMLYSASAYEAANDYYIQDDMFYFRKQALISAGAVLFALFVSQINYHISIRLAPLAYIIALGLMAMVKFTPLGVTVNGARRWLKIGIQFQPSEVAKIAIILIMPFLIMRMGRKLNSFWGVVRLLGVGFIQAMAAYLFTENLSTAVIIFGICAVIIFLAHPKTAPFIMAIVALALAGISALILMNRYVKSSTSFRMRRILAWLQPENNLNSGGYQVLQGLYAIGSGGLFGKGLGNSTQKLATIPEAQNDMIFSIICEELGLFGAIMVLVLFAYLLYRLLFIAQNAPDLYGTLAASGIMAHVALQVILNISVVLNVIPTTGVTLPFVSYGGTSVVFLMYEIGLALNISKNIRFEE